MSKGIVASELPNLPEIEGVTIPELVWSNLALKKNKVAFECYLTGQKYTFDDVYRQSRSFAAALLATGLKAGQVVSVLLPNVVEFPSIFFGILDAGGIVSTINPEFTEHEIVRQVAVTSAAFAVTIPVFLPAIRAAAKKVSTLHSIVVLGEPQEGCLSFSQMLTYNTLGVNFLVGAQINTRETVALLPFSSGTTGLPKGVKITHFNIVANVTQFLTPNCGMMHNVSKGEEQDRLIGVIPFFHIYGLTTVITAAFFAGNHTLCIPKFHPETFLNQVRQIKPHVIILTPPIIVYLANHTDISANDFETVRCIQTGGAPIGAALLNKITEKAEKNVFIQDSYGMTEASPDILILNPKFGNTKVGSCGNVIPNTVVKIVDIDNKSVLGPNKQGELWVKGPQIMKGYYKNMSATMETIDTDGWLHTGDVLYYDEDHCFYIVGRIKELIRVLSGPFRFQVAPAELEELLRNHPEIADVAVIGVSDGKDGEVPRAYVVSKSETLTENHIHKFLDGKVAKFKELKGGVEFVKCIQKSASGKIMRRELKQAYLESKGEISK